MPVIKVTFHGPAKDWSGLTAESLTVDDSATVKDVAAALAGRYSKIAEARGMRLALNRKYAAPDQPVGEGDEIAVIPPVSGG